MLPIFIALTLAVCLVPLFRASAANPSPGAFSATGLLSQFGSNYRLLPSLAARFAPQDVPQDDPPEGPNSDLGVTKLVVGSDNVGADSNVTYSIEVRNGGPNEASSVTLTDILPVGMTFVSLTQTSGPAFSCSTPSPNTNGTVTCTISSFVVNDSAVFTLVAHIPANTEPGTSFNNTATVSTASTDFNDENNSSSAGAMVATTSADVGVAKSVGSDTVRADADVTYTIEVRNGGPDVAADVTLSDTLPGDMTFVSLTQVSGPTFSCTTPSGGTSGNPANCSIASLPVGSLAVFTLVGHVPSGTSDGATYQNTATVSTSTQDPNDINNSSNATATVVTCNTDVAVTTNADSGAGSLRQAILDACPGSTIIFAPNVVGFITLTSGELLIDKNLTIRGPGASLLTVMRSTAIGTSNFRIFNVASGNIATISGLAMANGVGTPGGNSVSDGGAILNDGMLALVSSVVTGNVAGTGGGIDNHGTLVINSSTISNSHADTGSGGGIYNSGLLTIINSTINGNTAFRSGGIEVAGGSASITNSTISGNSAIGDGGGIQTIGGTATLTNVTLTNNHSDSDNNGSGSGGGIRASTGITLRNTIVAGNYKGSATSTADDIALTVDPSSSFNLIGTGGSGGLNNSNGNQVNVANPGLVPLTNNGGQTQTHALRAGSPALDGGSNALLPADAFDMDNDGNTSEPLPFDQRGAGFLRVTDAADANTTQTVDIGAFEAQVSVEDITDKATNEDTPLSVTFNVGDPALITGITYTSSNTTLVPSANLTISGTGSTRTLQITPAANLSGTTTITITILGNNSQAMADTFVVNVNAVNDAPQASGESYSTNENTQLNVAAPGVLSNDTDVDNATLTAIKVSDPSNGTAALNSNGSFSYTPQAGFSGTDSFTYKANDGAADSNVATVTINVNEGGTLAFSSATYSVNENGGSASITITRTGGSAGTATVLFQTSNGTASSSDYTAVSQTVTFNDGETSKTINVPITDDQLDEADETVNLTLSNAGGSGQLGTPSTAVLTINDDDVSPGISIDDVQVQEGNSGTTNAVFTVTLSAASSLTVKVDYATANGTATTAGNDYQSASGTLTFNPGDPLTKTITVLVNGDTVNEPNETFTVNLTNPQNTTISDAQGLGTILNDDAPGVQFSNNTYTFSEGAGHGDIVVTRTGDISSAITVDYSTSDQSGTTPCQTNNTGFASDRCDYATAAGTLSFAAGEAQKTIQLILINDAYVEGPEQLSIKLTNPVGATLGSTDTATVTIADNDTQIATVNPIDDLDFFIREQYIDFLGREPDAAGFQFWKTRMTNNCPPDQTCDRIDTALRFFGSDEFKERGYFVYVFYHAALGRRPTYAEWIMDVSKLN
ncbi:MAG TPA: Calx-beta domain-containing protein, partial [Pyrinomonadaceae bacterium]